MKAGSARVGGLAGRLALGALGLAVAARAGAQDLSSQPIIITAPQLFRDVTPERQLDQEAIESYGLSTIDELLSELQVELGDGEDFPLIVVNGERLNSIEEIAALPVEALRDIVVLPRGSAVRAGGTASQRVVSLTLKPLVRSITLTAAEKRATEGDFHAERGEAIATYVKGRTRFNVAMRGRQDGLLFESERGITATPPRRPFAIDGNIIGYPNTSGPIDPALSTLAGQAVFVTPLLHTAAPALADFVAGANAPATTDIGDYRTLRPRTRNYDLNATFSTRLAEWLSGNASLRLTRSPTLAFRGLPSATFVLAPANPVSPFDNPVAIAVYGKRPLRYEGRRDGLDANVGVDATFGKWSGDFDLRHRRSTDRNSSERELGSAAIALADSVNPFTADLTGMIPLRHDRAISRSVDTEAEFNLNGPLLHLPAGDIIAALEGSASWNRIKSETTYNLLVPKTAFKRSEQMLRASLDIPLTSRAANALAATGDWRITGEIARRFLSDAGNLDHYAAGLNWSPFAALDLRASLDETEFAPSIQIIGNPIIVTPDVRVFDPLTGETVEVTQITGGNPSAKPQSIGTRRLSATLRLLPKWNMQLTAEYLANDRRDFISYLPDQSAAIMLAFPDRFIRDSDGRLISVDLRPVNFEEERDRQLRWGVNFNRKLGSPPPPPPPVKRGEKRPPRRQQPYVQFNLNHTIVLADDITIRPGLPRVDLLGGGAIGIGGGKVWHQLDASAAFNASGLGARASLSWRGPSKLLVRSAGDTDTLAFSDVALLNLRLFADARHFFPDSRWAKGLRVSLDVNNLFNDRQRVRDSAGDTPLQYQRGYRDPIGRAVELEIRAVF